ncbi:MAG TPA: bifunctional riboflavin kinase/FAD synthetase [Clostridia bacterium]|nr:bifunctional riboflavin kinase/FAD synthetase [Clostridia bacterium]
MEHSRTLEMNQSSKEKSVVALGMFDGVHAGHRQLLSTAAALAKNEGLRFVVYTFKNHPLSVFQKSPKLLCSFSERVKLLYSFGANLVEADDFTLELAATEPEAFVKSLYERFNIKYAVAGFNYSFGKNGAGNTALLKELGKKLGFKTCEVEPYLFEGKPVSSTRIRMLLQEGNISASNAMLEREYSLSGTVIRNRRIGNTIGFPTANLGGIDDMALPGIGVYATRTFVDNETYHSVTSIGKNPTVGGKSVSVETHIMDFDRDIYGKTLTVSFAEFLRGELPFDNVDELAKQIKRDVERARGIL